MQILFSRPKERKTRIFVYKHITKDSEYDIYSGHNSNEVIDMVENHYHSCPNFGNKVWFQGIMSAISSGNNTFGFLEKNTTPEYINDNFDIVLLPMANIFGAKNVYFINHLFGFFSKIKIPTIVMSCGVQADSYQNIEELVKDIGEDSKKFIQQIYNIGGQFGVRGEFTKLFFEKLGFNNVVVTGCPSIYQNGKDLSISNSKIPENSFKYVVNGSIESFKSLLNNSNDSVYIDQYSVYELLFKNEQKNDISSIAKQYIKKYGLFALSLANKGRIQLFANPNDWRKYLISNGFSFSIGSRIHGSVMSILSGLPTAMCPIDSRTREMAEFYKIPIIDKKDIITKSVYEIYSELDFSDFNKQYKKNYVQFCDFLINSGLTDKVNNDNIFFDDNKDYVISKYPNADLITKICQEINVNYKKYRIVEKYNSLKRNFVLKLRSSKK